MLQSIAFERTFGGIVIWGDVFSKIREQGEAGLRENHSKYWRMARLKHNTSQGGVAAKRKRAGWDEDYVLLGLQLI